MQTEGSIMKMLHLFRILLISATIVSTFSAAPDALAKISSTVMNPPPKEAVEKNLPAEDGQEGRTSKVHRGFQLLVLLKMLK
jgi:hypothetical protein